MTEKYGPDYQMDVFTLNPREVTQLQIELERAMESGARVRVAIDGGLKIDTGIGWSLPMGTDTTGRS